MERFAIELRIKMKKELKEIATEPDPLIRYERSIMEIRSVTQRLVAYLQEDPFEDIHEEIRYYMKMAPKFYSRLFCFIKIYQAEVYCKYSSFDKIREMLMRELEGLNCSAPQYEIIRIGMILGLHSNEYYFTREDKDKWPKPESDLFVSPEFTLGSYWVSWIKANEQYKFWLNGKLADFRGDPNESSMSRKLAKLELKKVGVAPKIKFRY